MISLQTFFNHSAISIESEFTQSTNSRISSTYKFIDYDTIKLIGQGTFADVYLVRKKTSKEIYAIKVVGLDYFTKKGIKAKCTKQNFIESFLNEKKIMSEVDHPFINKLEQSFIYKNSYCLVSQFYQGGELRFHLNKVGRFNERATKFYSSQVLLALEYLHDNNIIYRE